MNVARYMQRDAVTALPSATVSAVRTVMEEHGFGLLLVAGEDGKLLGFVTRGSVKGVSDGDAPIERVAHPARFAVTPSDTLEKAALILLENRLVLLPVVSDEGHLLGVLTQTEVLRGLAEGLGIGQEGTRLSIKMSNGTDLYDVLTTLKQHDAKLVSIASGSQDLDDGEIIVRIQRVADRDKLRDAIETQLLEHNA